MQQIAQHMIVFGCIGLLVEVFFTGIKSLMYGNRRAISHTYLWMIVVYGVGGLAIEYIRMTLVHTHPLLRGIVSMLVIFIIEFIFGALLKKILGTHVWRYSRIDSPDRIHRLSVHGHIRIDYAPYWYILAVSFDYLLPSVVNVINHLTIVG